MEKLPLRRLLSVRFIRDAAVSTGAQVSMNVAAMLGGVLVARVLGPEGRGTLAVLTALGAMAVLLASLGLQTSSIYFMGRFKDDRDTIVINNTLVGLIGGLVTAGLLVLAGLALHDVLLPGIPIYLFLLYALCIPFNYFSDFASRTALGLGKVFLMNTAPLTGGVGLLIGTAGVLAVFGAHIAPLIVLRVLIEVVTATILFVSIFRATGLTGRPSRVLLRRQLHYGLRNYASSLMWLFLLQSDVVLCNHFLGTGPTGVYSVAAALGLTVTILGAPIGTLVFQRVAAEEDPAVRASNTNYTMRLLVPVIGVSAVLIAAASPWLVPIVYGEEFRGAVTALLLLLPGLIALTLETVLMNFLAGDGSPSIVYRAPILGLVVNVGANLFVIPRWGINGAAVTSSVGYLIVFFVVVRFYMRWTGSSLGDVLRTRGADLALLRGLGRSGVEASAA
jgi:O-antigen/teichoic acid export membrane protein